MSSASFVSLRKNASTSAPSSREVVRSLRDGRERRESGGWGGDSGRVASFFAARAHAGVGRGEEIGERQRSLEGGAHALLLGNARGGDEGAQLGGALAVVARAHALAEGAREREG